MMRSDQTRSPSPLSSRTANSSSEGERCFPGEQKRLGTRRHQDDAEQKCLGVLADQPDHQRLRFTALPEVVTADSRPAGGLHHQDDGDHDDGGTRSPPESSVGVDVVKPEAAPSLTLDSEEKQVVATDDDGADSTRRRPWYKRWRRQAVASEDDRPFYRRPKPLIICGIATILSIVGIVVGAKIQDWTFRPPPSREYPLNSIAAPLSSTVFTLSGLPVIATAYQRGYFSVPSVAYLRDAGMPYATSQTLFNYFQASSQYSPMPQTPMWLEEGGNNTLFMSMLQIPLNANTNYSYVLCWAQECSITAGCFDGMNQCVMTETTDGTQIHRDSPFAHFNLSAYPGNPYAGNASSVDASSDDASIKNPDLFFVRGRSASEPGSDAEPFALMQFASRAGYIFSSTEDYYRKTSWSLALPAGRDVMSLSRMPASLLPLQNVNGTGDSWIMGSFTGETSLDAYHLNSETMHRLSDYGLPTDMVPPNSTLASARCYGSLLIFAVSSTRGGIIRQLEWKSLNSPFWPIENSSSEDLVSLPPADPGKGILSASCIASTTNGTASRPFISYWSNKNVVYSTFADGKWAEVKKLVPD